MPRNAVRRRLLVQSPHQETAARRRGMGSDHHGGGGACNNRSRKASSFTDDDDDKGETSRRRKICEGAPTSGRRHDGESSDGTGDACGRHAQAEPHNDGAGADEEGYKYEFDDCDDGAGEEDCLYEYDDCDDGEEGDEQAQDDAPASCAGEQRYVVLTEEDIRARQEADTAKVAEVLSISPGFAAVLLRHFKWRVGRVQEEWFTDDRRVRGAVGLPAPEDGDDLVVVPDARGPRPQVCGICFDPYPAGGTRSAGCSHYYCDCCWSGYVAAAVGDGPRCLSMRCPESSCSAPVVQELVNEVAGAADKARYARFWFRSYVEESGERIKWCGGAGCTHSVEFLGCAGDADAATDVFCGCRHGFCWGCGEEAHRPVSCGTVRAWLAKNASDSETANWVVANTKRCPKCRRPIEKTHGCNHMTCSAPCRHHFCWLCFDPWDDHRGCTRYRYRQRQKVVNGLGKAAVANNEEARRRQAKASLDRYLYHYERWAANGKSLQKALSDMDELERSELGRMAGLVDLPAMELGFLTEAYRQIADGRRVLRWAHAYAYFLFLDPERDAAKRDLLDDLQSQANRWLECLHGCAELERKELFGDANDDGESTVSAKAFSAYKEKVANLTGVTRRFMGNLVTAFKTNLPEVVVTPAFERIVNGPTMGSQTVGVGSIISTATVTLEPAAMLPMVSGPCFWHVTPISNVALQGISTPQTSSPSLISQEANIADDSVQELSNQSQFPPMNSTFFGDATSMGTGLPNIGATPLQVHMSNIISSGVTSTPSVTFSMSGPGQPTGSQEMAQSTAFGSFGSNTPTVWDNSNIAASSSQPYSMGMDTQAGINSLSSGMNAPIGLHPNAQQFPPNYVRIWEGTLSGQRQGQPVFISKLESWSGTMSKTIAADWPETMQIVRLIAQEHMNKKQYVGKADFLIFQTLNQHEFLGQLQEKKLCAVIQLPLQTLLLSMSDKASHLIGMLLPKQENIQQQQDLQYQQQLQQQQQQQNMQQFQQQLLHEQQMQQMQHQQQHMQVSTQNLPMLQQKLHLQQQLQHQQQLHLHQHLTQQIQQQQPRYPQQLWQQMQHLQQLRQLMQQRNHRQEYIHKWSPNNNRRPRWWVQN